ncbi:MAG: 2-succinyl-5-enolpyruvyl-6-hydroxy-3-cyclohexene-1-carboxylic-acid synthase, partial [Acidimicrobiaceae bacterium]|nr:2-succinyl-5-enolpyruvyl-6-hydroxy-3-cyclohexene-1-carboxylic-acid synthase [Acidimicrobiaceae bacterium]
MTEPVYDVVAAFVARLAAFGVTEAVISPGSRSTPLTLCFDAQPRIRTWIQLDERSAGFFALGLGRATGRPAVLVCTSGTAAANYLPAVVEASHAGVPMIVCTADRPPELRGWGSPQTIDQVGLYGTAVRWSIDLPVPDEASVDASAGWADTALARASGSDPGPVHLNWPLREPLEPSSTVPVPGQPAAAVDAGHMSGAEDPGPSKELSDLAEIVAGCERGVVVAGPWPGGGLDRERRWAAHVKRFAAWAGWPVIGEPISHIRGGSRAGGLEGGPRCVVAGADHLLADEALAEALRPDVAVLAGRTVTTKPVRLWLERTRPRHVVLIDPV